MHYLSKLALFCLLTVTLVQEGGCANKYSKQVVSNLSRDNIDLQDQLFSAENTIKRLEAELEAVREVAGSNTCKTTDLH
ncbi:hypothetical protein COY25_02905 [Candidatus Uhrbacteria bacterium CG_4_10_14_0_2_um_filter_41_7]|uniref:Uncharacterized protein n=1 Tax=Candidatus Uhrbacteria bacterium CG_4_9_14_3_um_filter_41_35 TaxID=1975034 RepID=A0A2M7XDQ0_9BACT|nr:MAG: hypothetical protein COV92_01310 [Candidatus Uhrbacteria bacterium CG11_big_fil_rev_8_21_14_0_20_41_9]PIZ53868.1 MAG: hypothetical protein COY25_02905 [Candidatus Uhrbacteria bacterium CG_4_10_14_0_2_um_filter_41_7]PJA46007.1 MAG: hypothetical protein CO173_03985 [Candidatus Uhrbacteria bacterium CG_4_9_14_3_um_filter_41_35]